MRGGADAGCGAGAARGAAERDVDAGTRAGDGALWVPDTAAGFIACAVRAAETAAAVGTGTGRMSLTTAPFCCTSVEIVPKFFTLPRGTPNPADPSRITTCRGETPG